MSPPMREVTTVGGSGADCGASTCWFWMKSVHKLGWRSPGPRNNDVMRGAAVPCAIKAPRPASATSDHTTLHKYLSTTNYHDHYLTNLPSNQLHLPKTPIHLFIIMASRRLLTGAGIAGAGGVVYYLYSAGGSPKVAEAKFERMRRPFLSFMASFLISPR
ncbi:hypothetical protein GQ43DRAFT_19789 [Delitschia confertaspora ATCC 74209]|uniref:Uncharacterized protein n=1 Tax=Delitschia confertaspora ATCC 74209 TaxID=1513339 RepID=A0A9P4MQI2_9PLEO|nr:hypothetical protein GQ43DRAFT_19789 [Delitschia confertaspora ATCC 74209]